jgi:hypothetical protein
MTDLLIENTGAGWDLALSDGDLALTHKVSRSVEVAQRVVYRLLTWLGESVYDRRAGVPYFETVFGDEPIPEVVALFIQIVIETEGVDGLVGSPSFVLDNRELAIQFEIQVGPDVETISLQVAP